MDKKQLRKKYIDLRNIILDKELKSEIIEKRILQNEYFKNSRIISFYVSLPNEVGTIKLINESLELGKIVVVPKVINKSDMNFYKINSLDDLTCISRYNIREPKDIKNNIVLPNLIDLFIVPGICFDKNKNRLGYGCGYYDRYLMKCPNSYKIGIAFNDQILLSDYIKSEDTDIKLDEIITDKILIK